MLSPKEIILNDSNCIVKAFENNNIEIIKQEPNTYLFRANDIGKILELSNIRVSIQNYDETERVVRIAYDQNNRAQETIFLTSHGVYRLLYNSKKEIAKKFRKWVGKILDDIIFTNNKILEKQLVEKETELQLKIIEHEYDIKITKHKVFLDKMRNKNCIYIGEITKELIKIGSSQDIFDRKYDLIDTFGNILFLDVFETNDFRDIEQNILHKLEKYKYRDVINGIHISKEVVKLTNEFNYNQLLTIVKNEIKNYVNLQSVEFLELKRINLENTRYELINELLKKDFAYEEIDVLLNSSPEDHSHFNNNSNSFNEKNNLNTKSTDVNDTNKHVIIKHENEYVPIIINNSRGRKIQKIDPHNLNTIVKIYNSMIDVLRDVEYNYEKTSIRNAIKNNTIYKGFRWLYVEKHQDSNIVNNIIHTVQSQQFDFQYILQLNKDKSEIIEMYDSIYSILKILKISYRRINKILKEGSLLNDTYFIKKDQCPKELLEKYNKPLKCYKSPKRTSIKAVNILSKKEIIFHSKTEIQIKYNVGYQKLNKIIKDNITFLGCKWELL
jgi:prophage antirepressor-like protein